MKAPRSNFNPAASVPSLGAFSLDDLEAMGMRPEASSGNPATTDLQYHIIVKRDTFMFKMMSLFTSLLAVSAVLLVIATFLLMFYALITVTEVQAMVTQVQAHNEALLPDR